MLPDILKGRQMSSKLKASVAALALLAILGPSLVQAQTAPTPAEPPAATAPAAGEEVLDHQLQMIKRHRRRPERSA